MATNHTEHYGLNLWEPQDAFTHTEFNENTEKLEAAIHNLAEQTEAALQSKPDAETLTTLQQTLSKTPQIVYGSYSGRGTFGEANPNTLNFAGKMEHSPRLVIIVPAQNRTHKLLLISGVTATNSTEDYYEYENQPCTITWKTNSVSWYCTKDARGQLNESGKLYYYVAIG